MITIMPESNETILVVKASGLLTHDDYEMIFLPELNACINKNGKARTLFYMDESFQGWELDAAWDDAKFGVLHRRDFTRLAIVGGPDWVAWCIKVGEFFISGDTKTFHVEQFHNALKWVAE